MRRAGLLAVPLALACGAPQEEFPWPLGEGLPVPLVPDDNPMSDAKVELGRHLFYDKRLSGNQTQACASCHLQELAFTDGLAVSEGSKERADVLVFLESLTDEHFLTDRELADPWHADAP